MDTFKRRDLFNGAADLLEKEDWTQGTMCRGVEGGGEAYCLVGALRMIRYGTPYPDEANEPEEGMHGETYAGITADALIHWNDEVAKDVDEVVARLRDLAAGKEYTSNAWKYQ